MTNIKICILLFHLFCGFLFSDEKVIPPADSKAMLSSAAKNSICGADDKSCLNPNLKNICPYFSDKSYELQDKIRVSKLLISTDKSTADLAKKLQVLRTCELNNDIKAFIVAFSYIETTGAKKTFLDKWLLTLKKRESTQEIDILKLLISSVYTASSESATQVPLDQIIKLQVFIVEEVAKLIQKKMLSKDLEFENFLRKASFDFLLTGRGNYIELLLKDHIRSYISDKNIFISIIENACTHWYYTDQGALCAKEMLKLAPMLDKKSNSHNLTLARTLFFQNKVDQAVQLMRENIERGTKDNSDQFLAWGYYGLSNYLPFVGKVDEGKKSLLEFKKLMDIKKLGWLGAIVYTREQSHAFDKGDYEKSLEFGKMAIDFLNNKVSGKTSEMAWTKYFRLMALYKLKKVGDFKTEMQDLLSYISDMPSMQFLAYYSKLMAQALKVEVDLPHKTSDIFNKNDPEYHRLLKVI